MYIVCIALIALTQRCQKPKDSGYRTNYSTKNLGFTWIYHVTSAKGWEDVQLDFLIAGFARSGTHSVRGGTKSSQGHFINILETCSATFLVLAADIIIYIM